MVKMMLERSYQNIGEVDYYPAVFLFKNDKEQSAIEMNPEKDLGKSEDKKDSHA